MQAKDRSSLSIAHRLSTIINSDQIVVMKDGQIVEHGSYKDLLELNGAFAVM
jgi:ABC-type transport system involved in Fe-S cluster assembly fused permease/ATPase subunit